MTAIGLLVEWVLRSSALILCGALSLRALRVKDPALRLAAWTAMLCASLAMPLLTAVLPKAPLIRLAMPDVIAGQTGSPWEFDRRVPELESGGVPAGVHSAASRPAVSNGYDWARFALAIYSLIAGFFLLRLCAGLVMSGRLLRGSRATGVTTAGIEIRESDDVSAPLSLGVARAAIVLPCDWRDWNANKLDAVLAHERAHILRRDPVVQLFSAIHRALLWGSPLSWYLHRNIVQVAEEASDDAAVAATNDRASYAELLLEFMQRSAGGANWQGVAMARHASPEQRIHRILEGTAPSRGITRWRTAAIVALGSPLAFFTAAAHLRQATPARLTFQEASVKLSAPGSRGGPVRALPGGERYTAQDATVKLLISLMYKVPARQIVGGPAWLDVDGYDIEAKADHYHNLDDLHVMFRNLLADRFQLKFHTEIKQGPVYALTLDTPGSKMKINRSPELFDYPITFNKDSVVIGTRVPMEYFCWWLGQVLQQDQRPVIDKTGLHGNYDFTLSFTPKLPPGFSPDRLPAKLRDRPSIFDAVSGQLGLKLQEEQGPVESFVIDHLEKPAAQ